VVITSIAVALWSILFLGTFRYPLHWDDYHLIRGYSSQELASVFHGTNDPDHVETPSYRPVATLFFAGLGLLDDHLVAIRIASVLLMWIFLVVAGALLAELDLAALQIALVFTLLVSSRVFACLALWTTAGNMVVCYVCMLLAGYFVLVFARTGSAYVFLGVVVCACAAVLTREEAYALPLLFPLLAHARGATGRDPWRRVALASAGAALVAVVHRTLEKTFVAPVGSLRLGTGSLRRWAMAEAASWMPGGLALGRTPFTLGPAVLWIAFVGVILLSQFRSNALPRAGSGIVIGFVLCLPSLAVPRAMGVVLPQLAYMTLVVLAAFEFVRLAGRVPRGVLIAFVSCGLLIGVTSRLRRSSLVAEAMRPDCAPRAARDAEMIFDMYPQRVTIPRERLETARSRLAHFGLRSPADVEALRMSIERFSGPRGPNAKLPNGLFVPAYDYLWY